MELSPSPLFMLNKPTASTGLPTAFFLFLLRFFPGPAGLWGRSVCSCFSWWSGEAISWDAFFYFYPKPGGWSGRFELGLRLGLRLGGRGGPGSSLLSCLPVLRILILGLVGGRGGPGSFCFAFVLLLLTVV
ncbi:hypothetical protein BDV10DRAFT_154960 [Aspergillus recurvatus]